MATQQRKIRVALNGYGVIGKRVADAVASQGDMELVGIADIEIDWRMRTALQKGFRLFASLEDRVDAMRKAGLDVAGTLDDLLKDADVVVDCTPKPIGAKNADRYRQRGVKFIVQGGEKHEVTGHSFVAETSYASALGREATRVVSCNTTSIVRTL
jgi:glyceraldehyde-3-phosphate dehydrogenase (NAD(P))